MVQEEKSEPAQDKNPKDAVPLPLRRLLEEYADVFPEDLPTGLLPVRAFKHKIELVPGARPVAKPDYRKSGVEL